MKYRVITVAREFGSGGAQIARRLAERLGWNLLDYALVERVARSAKVDPESARRLDERVDSWLHRMARMGLWSGAFEAVPATPEALDIFDAETMATLTAGFIREAHGKGGCVIVGRGGQCELAGHTDVFRLFVYAGLAERIERVRHRPNAPADDAGVAKWIAEMDRTRNDYVRRHFGCDWTERHLYHLMIDSALGDDAAVSAVLAAMRFGEEGS